MFPTSSLSPSSRPACARPSSSYIRAQLLPPRRLHAVLKRYSGNSLFQPSSFLELEDASHRHRQVVRVRRQSHMQVGDRVLVEPVGVNATIKRLIPLWKFGKPEPVKIYFDCGLGRTFDKTE